MHICIGNLTVIGSDNGLSPHQCQAVIWTNPGILLNGPLGRNFEQWHFNKNSYIFIQDNSFENVICKMVPILSRLQCVNTCLCLMAYGGSCPMKIGHLIVLIILMPYLLFEMPLTFPVPFMILMVAWRNCSPSMVIVSVFVPHLNTESTLQSEDQNHHLGSKEYEVQQKVDRGFSLRDEMSYHKI